MKPCCRGVKDANKTLAEEGAKVKSASKLCLSPAKLKGHYLGRAMGGYVGMFGHSSDPSFYYPIGQEAKGQMSDGTKHDNTLTFKGDNFPPVKYFWSLTMYRLPQRLLVANEDNRYSFSNAIPDLKKAADGSVTFYISAKKPGDNTVNWLPAPEGPFWTVMRTYGPDKEILNGQWQVPPVQIVK